MEGNGKTGVNRVMANPESAFYKSQIIIGIGRMWFVVRYIIDLYNCDQYMFGVFKKINKNISRFLWVKFHNSSMKIYCL